MGVLPPVCLGILSICGERRRGRFQRRRAVKHGRSPPRARISYFVGEYSKRGGYLSPSMGVKCSEVPNGLVVFSKVPLACWIQIVAFCGPIENNGFTFAQWKSIGRMTAKLNAVLANGRLATMAIIRMRTGWVCCRPSA